MNGFVKFLPGIKKEYRLVRKSDNQVSSRHWAAYPTLWIKYNLSNNWRNDYDVVCYTYSGLNSNIVTR